MSQQEILDLLKKHPNEWFTSKEISKRLGVKSVSHSLRSLRRFGFIDFRPLETILWGYEYRYTIKRR